MRRDRLPGCRHLGVEALDLDDVSQVRGRVLDRVFEAGHHAPTPPPCDTIDPVLNVLPAAGDGEKGIGTVTSSPWEKAPCRYFPSRTPGRLMVALNRCVEVLARGHLASSKPWPIYQIVGRPTPQWSPIVSDCANRVGARQRQRLATDCRGSFTHERSVVRNQSRPSSRGWVLTQRHRSPSSLALVRNQPRPWHTSCPMGAMPPEGPSRDIVATPDGGGHE
jgi:hypothetical protein